MFTQGRVSWRDWAHSSSCVYTRQCILVGLGSQFRLCLHKAVHPGGTRLTVQVVFTQGSASWWDWAHNSSCVYTRQCILAGLGSQFKLCLHKAKHPGGTGLTVQVVFT